MVSEMHLFLYERPHQGSLRVRLVKVLPGHPNRPGSRRPAAYPSGAVAGPAYPGPAWEIEAGRERGGPAARRH